MSQENSKENRYSRPDSDTPFQASQTSKYAGIYIYIISQEENAATLSVEWVLVMFNNTITHSNSDPDLEQQRFFPTDIAVCFIFYSLF